VQVSGLSGVVAISCGVYHSLALKSDGTVWAWGANDYGQLGNSAASDSSAPVQVSGLSGVIAIAGGSRHSLALKSDGTVWAWGANDYGQLGNGTTVGSSTPVQVSGLSGVTSIAAGDYHTLALKSDGTLWAWGRNDAGQLGNGTTVGSSTPVQVSALSNVTAVAGGRMHTVAQKQDGTVWTWGDNYFGQLGNGTTTNSASPVNVSSLQGARAIASRGFHSLALVKRAVSDFDQDGKSDLIWHNQIDGQLVYWLMDGTVIKPGGMGHLMPYAANPTWKIVGTPDLDGDGKPDILWHNQTDGQLVYWLMDGVKIKPGGMGNLSPAAMNPVWRIAGTPDLDGDGKPDILWHNQKTGQLLYWLMDGVKLKSSGNLTPSVANPAWKIVGTPDLDGDGKPDILWHNQTDGQLVYWLMDGVKVKPGGMGHLTPSVANPAWKIVGTPDLDGDGKPDILWHNQKTGQLLYWLMDGAKLKPGGSGLLTPSVVSPIWELEPGS
jgi:hypothetical protein